MSDPDRSDHIRKLAELIEDVDIAMLTTVGPDGRLVSRPLGTQEVEFDGDLWFATGADSGKVAEIRANPQVNVAYASAAKNTYVSVSGKASIVDDREKIERFWSPAMKVFFPEGKDDPNLRLIHVAAESAEYWDGPGSAVGKALSLATAAVTGDPGAMTDNERIDLG
ncbi:pyridoxamine 5'-phosphate oxidase family protein [Luteimonas sp. RD2P54]|uniref:Pyridoxamine 5'-phosphate oxidase family protein n=1 Tax=Luteimonas endophytica TaxID=3042023 RepID=A0ABT6JB06_9GAMM|nr:pyridoxamine 5'-phosphate oxidase family protein [Luteimonas endophytica]MDH5823939.1 pyridoxamine 5'-phosphate oxidase family protein [Luteimonas endophytica]